MGRLIPVFVFPHFVFWAALLVMPMALTGLASFIALFWRQPYLFCCPRELHNYVLARVEFLGTFLRSELRHSYQSFESRLDKHLGSKATLAAGLVAMGCAPKTKVTLVHRFMVFMQSIRKLPGHY